MMSAVAPLQNLHDKDVRAQQSVSFKLCLSMAALGVCLWATQYSKGADPELFMVQAPHATHQAIAMPVDVAPHNSRFATHLATKVVEVHGTQNKAPQLGESASTASSQLFQTAPGLLLTVLSSCLVAITFWAYRARQFATVQCQPIEVQFMEIWSAAAVGDADVADDALEDEDAQDGDSPSGGASADQDGLDEVVVDPIVSSMSASDQVRMAIINEVRGQFHRAVTPLQKDSTEGTEAADLTHSALFMTRMIRVIGQKAEDLVELQDLPSDNLTSAQSLKYFLMPSTAKLRALLANETSRAADLFFRQNMIAARKELQQAAPQLMAINNVQLPFLLPVQSGLPRPTLLKPDVLLDAIAPELSADEQAYAYALEQLAAEVYGKDLADFLSGRTVGNSSTLVQQVITTFSNTVTSGAREAANILQPEFTSGLRKRISETEFGELALAVQSLETEERKVLREWVTEVLEKGWQILLRRIAPLASE